MKFKPALFVALALLTTVAASAKKTERVPPPQGVLPVVITEMTIGDPGNAYGAYERLAYHLERVAQERNWPLKVAAEKIAANAPDYLTELRISLQRVRHEIPGEFIYRAWTTLTIDGKDHDFGIISYSYRFRLGENMDDVLDKSFRGGARATADKIEPILFPDLKTKKK